MALSDPIVTSDDLATYLNDASIQIDRADMMIFHAQALCESILSPLPANAAGIVIRVAGRGYVTTTSARGAQIAAGGSPFGGAPGGFGGVYLTRSDKADLRRLSGSGGAAFSIDLLPAGYLAPVSYIGAVDGSEYGYGDWDAVR